MKFPLKANLVKENKVKPKSSFEKGLCMDVKNYEAICSGIWIRKKYESVLRKLKLERHLPGVTREQLQE